MNTAFFSLIELAAASLYAVLAIFERLTDCNVRRPLSVLLEKIAVMVVTSSADRLQIYSERVRNLSGLNHTKLEQDGGNSVRLIQARFAPSLIDTCSQDR